MKKMMILCSFLLWSVILLFSQNENNKNATLQDDVKGIVKYVESNKEEELSFSGGLLLISGNENKLTITGILDKIILTGKNNDVTIVSVNTIILTGNGNFVSWEKTSNNKSNPVIQDNGGYNNIGKRSNVQIK